MSSAMTIKGRSYGPLNVNIDRELSTNVWLNVSMRTGKNREIRRIMEKCDLQVNKLIRVAYGPYKLGSVRLRLLSCNTQKSQRYPSARAWRGSSNSPRPRRSGHSINLQPRTA